MERIKGLLRPASSQGRANEVNLSEQNAEGYIPMPIGVEGGEEPERPSPVHISLCFYSLSVDGIFCFFWDGLIYV